jgi:hypothetical protein
MDPLITAVADSCGRLVSKTGVTAETHRCLAAFSRSADGTCAGLPALAAATECSAS